MVPLKYRPIVFAFFFSLVMGAILSFAFTAINVGFNEAFVPEFIKSSLISLLIAWPVSLIITPTVNHITSRCTKQDY